MNLFPRDLKYCYTRIKWETEWINNLGKINEIKFQIKNLIYLPLSLIGFRFNTILGMFTGGGANLNKEREK